jgi:uncharacterized membrane protein YfcA
MDVGHTLNLTLFVALGVLSAIYIFCWWHITRGQRTGVPSLAQLAIGFVTNFFDTFGIGSFALTTTAYKLLGLVRDENIPGTMIVGHTLPSLAQAIIFLTVINVEPVLLVLTILAMSLGGWLGVGMVARLSRRRIQILMGVALLLAAWSLLMSQFGLFPAGGDATGLPVGKTAIAVAMYFVFGALLTLGIGHYAPSLVLFSLLGLNVRAAFPIMAGAASFAGPLAAIRFLAKQRCDPRAALGLTLGGIPGVLLAAFVVKSLPLDVLRWLVVVVIVYTAVSMLRSAHAERQRSQLIAEEKLL